MFSKSWYCKTLTEGKHVADNYMTLEEARKDMKLCGENVLVVLD